MSDRKKKLMNDLEEVIKRKQQEIRERKRHRSIAKTPRTLPAQNPTKAKPNRAPTA